MVVKTMALGRRPGLTGAKGQSEGEAAGVPLYVGPRSRPFRRAPRSSVPCRSGLFMPSRHMDGTLTLGPRSPAFNARPVSTISLHTSNCAGICSTRPSAGIALGRRGMRVLRSRGMGAVVLATFGHHKHPHCRPWAHSSRWTQTSGLMSRTGRLPKCLIVLHSSLLTVSTSCPLLTPFGAGSGRRSLVYAYQSPG